MQCDHCGHELPLGSRFCIHCGDKIIPVMPEGFVLDAESGWYYKSAVITNAEGRLEQLVTYYDAETAEYAEVAYPIAQEAVETEALPIQEAPVPEAPAIPEGFVLDAESGWYYKSAVITNAEGRLEQRVTYFDLDTGEYAEAVYPMEQDAMQSGPQQEPQAPEQREPQVPETPVWEAPQPILAAVAPQAIDDPVAREAPAFFAQPTPPPAPKVMPTPEAPAPFAPPTPPPAIPEGFMRDAQSGLYYTSVVTENDKGQRGQLVTYFDAQTGAYTQATYPMEPLAPPPQPKEKTAKTEPSLPPTPPPARGNAARKAAPQKGKKGASGQGYCRLVLDRASYRRGCCGV